MMTNLCCKVLQVLEGKTLATAESCTGGGIGAAITAIPGSSAVYKGGIISYTNQVKEHLLGVPRDVLEREGAVSASVAEEMAKGVRRVMRTDVAVSVTGLAGPGGDSFGNFVGTVFIGYCDEMTCCVHKFLFSGDRETVREQSIKAALELILLYNKKKDLH